MFVKYLFAALVVLGTFSLRNNEAFQTCEGFSACDTNVGLILSLAAPSIIIALTLDALCGGLASLLERTSSPKMGE